jgi:hypothetical protein
MLKNDVLLPEISKYFNIGDTTLRKRIREIYNVNSVREARKYVKSQE